MTGISGPWLYSGVCQALNSVAKPGEKNQPAARTATEKMIRPGVR